MRSTKLSAGGWAKGLPLDSAYADVGFTPRDGHATRLVMRVDVFAHIAKLRRELADKQDASPQAVVAALVRPARASQDRKSAAGVKEARMNLLEAHRVQTELAA